MPDKEFKFTKEDFNYLRNVVKKETGIISDEGKYTMYYSRLARRVRKLGLNDFTQYRDYLNKNLKTESVELVNAVTTNLTAFFREEHHFDFLKNDLIAQKKKSQDKSLKIWSAACSTGEEAYSIAIAIREAITDYQNWDIKILATDIDSHVLATARKGVYKTERVNGLSNQRIKNFMKKGTGNNKGFIRMNEDVREMIQFNQLNLLKSWPIKQKFDAIFCRNVVIYFDKETKVDLVNRFANQLKNKAYLLMGHSESLFNISERFDLMGKSIYRLEHKE